MSNRNEGIVIPNSYEIPYGWLESQGYQRTFNLRSNLLENILCIYLSSNNYIMFFLYMLHLSSHFCCFLVFFLLSLSVCVINGFMFIHVDQQQCQPSLIIEMSTAFNFIPHISSSIRSGGVYIYIKHVYYLHLKRFCPYIYLHKQNLLYLETKVVQYISSIIHKL